MTIPEWAAVGQKVGIWRSSWSGSKLFDTATVVRLTKTLIVVQPDSSAPHQRYNAKTLRMVGSVSSSVRLYLIDLDSDAARRSRGLQARTDIVDKFNHELRNPPRPHADREVSLARIREIVEAGEKAIKELESL
jgi:hypothetical protein